jgi:3-dehydroquinate dehydratase-2
MRILIINGPNLNLLGTRETQIYGIQRFEDFLAELQKESTSEIDYFQSNIEGEIIDQLQSSDHDGIVLNAAGYTHTSVAIRDCIAAINKEVVEVHISNIASRESFRHESLITPVVTGCIFGFGLESYRLAISYFEKNKR